MATRLVWLEPLDMETLPRTANLMAAILARIGAACDGLDLLRDPRGRRGEVASARGSGGLLDPSPEYPALCWIFNGCKRAWRWRGR